MKDNYRIAKQDNVIKISFFTGLFFLISTVVITGIFFKSLPPFIPLLNSLSWGGDRIVPVSTLFILPIAVFFVLILNGIIGVTIYKRNPLLARIAIFNSFLFCFLTCLAAGEVLFLVF